MIALIVIGAIIFIVSVLLFLPLTIDLAYEGELLIKIRYLGITFKNNKRKKHKKLENDDTQEDDDDFLIRTYHQKGLLGTVQYLCRLLKILLTKFLWIVKRFKFRRLKLNLTVATDDAANTAIRYGEVCAAAYPVLSLLYSALDIKSKEINIGADFEKSKTEFNCSVLARTPLVFWFVAVFAALKEDFILERKESEKNERKQSKDRNGHNT